LIANSPTKKKEDWFCNRCRLPSLFTIDCNNSTHDPDCRCKKEEKIIKVCANCGYKDTRKSPTFLQIIITAFIIYVLFTLVFWFSESSYTNTSLLEALQNQWHWLKELKIY